MKNRTITYMLAGIILVLFISYFGVKEVVRSNMHFNESIGQVVDYAKQEQWEKAHALAKETRKDWKKYRLLINMNYGESEHALFNESLNSLVAGSEAEDLPTVLDDAKNVKQFWKNLNKIVPGP